MVLVFFIVNLLRIDLYDVVKEIKKGRDTMKTIIKRSILDYLKNPVLWIGLIIIVASMYQCLSSYLQIHYIKQNEQITQNDVALEMLMSWMGTFPHLMIKKEEGSGKIRSKRR